MTSTRSTHDDDNHIDFDALFGELIDITQPVGAPSHRGLRIVAREVVRAGVGMEAPFVLDFGLQPGGDDSSSGGAEPTLASLADAEHWMICEVIAWLAGKGLDKLVGIFSVSLTTLCSERFPREVAAAAHAGGIPLERLCFEIPAATVTNANEATLASLRALHGAGCSFALSEFVPDAAGFDALKRLPTRYLRISLANLDDGPSQRNVLRTAQRLARGLGIAVIADGVDDAERFRRTQDTGVAYASGDFLGTPAPLETV